MKRCFIRSIIAMSVACVACGETAPAGDYPAPTRINGLTAGGGGDVLARTIAEELRRITGLAAITTPRGP
jgi:tripartite-type tricarboxylate transporter receptor subunit TctC